MAFRIDIAAIAKREDMTILDWVEYHRRLGIRHIHIFDNSDSGDYTLRDLLRPYVDFGYVTVYDVYMGLPGKQIECYNGFMEYNYNNKIADWVFFTDCDEYISLRQGYNNIQDFFGDLVNRCENIGVLYTNWECYTANHQVFYEPRPVTLRFGEPFPNEFKANTHIKSCVSCDCRAVMNTPHDAVPQDGKLIYDTLFRNVSFGPYQEIRGDYNMYINHYLTKSLQEYFWQKYKRNTSMDEGPVKYTVDFFLQYCGDRDFYVNKINSLTA